MTPDKRAEDAHVAGQRRPDRAGKVWHFTPDERAARGKATRAEIARKVLGEWEPPPHRPDPIDLLEDQAKTRVPALVPVRYGRMLVSPFTFYRGAAALMASDLADSPRTGLHVQLCGDAHLSNFGAFAAPDRGMVFDINDFDETLPGPFEWDVKRLVASFAVAGRDRGFSAKVRRDINATAARAYREAMWQFAAMRHLDLWYARLDLDETARRQLARATPAQEKRLAKNVAHATTKDSLKAFGKFTQVIDGEPRFISDPPRIVPIDELAGAEVGSDPHEDIATLLRSYRRTLPGDRRRLLERYRYVDTARKVVGVGSVGTRAWVVLLIGRDNDDPLILQAKEAEASVLEPYLGRSSFASHGQRVVEGQRLMQAAGDTLLGWLRNTITFQNVERHYYIRQLWDTKGSALVELMEPDALGRYASLCGFLLARAHARSGDAIAIASYLGKGGPFDRTMAAFAEAYADQNERDYAALKEAVELGQVEAQTGV